MATNNASNESSAGIQVGASSGARSAVTITGTANQISVSNGDGTGGNPTLSLTSTIQVSGISFDSGSNTLSAYSTGTWTPAYVRTSLSTTYNHQVGIYEKIGTHVMISGYCQVNAVSNAGSGNLTMSGLPFTSSSTSAYLAGLGMGRSNISYPTNTTFATVEVQGNATTLNIFANVATTAAFSQAISLTNSGGISLGGVYSV